MTDAHCHPYNLIRMDPKYESKALGIINAEQERLPADIAYAACSGNREQFEYNEAIIEKIGKKIRNVSDTNKIVAVRCYGIHPQFPRYSAQYSKGKKDLLSFLQEITAEGRLDAIGETGFDLFDDQHRETEKKQDELFIHHLEIAVKQGLPMVIHVRRAMHKIFPHTKNLKKLPAVIFHSWPGTPGEGESLLRRGINAYFSFGSQVVNNHKTAIRSVVKFPIDRLLLETDAPYQPIRGKANSSWADLRIISRAITAMRRESGQPEITAQEFESIIDANFKSAYGVS